MPATPELWRALGQANTSEGDPSIFFGDQYDPKVIHLSNGNILVGWVSNQTTGAGSAAGTDIIGRLYDPLGNAIGDEFQLNQGRQVDNERDFDLAATANGGFAMVLIDADINNSTDTDVWLLEFNSAGTVIDENQIAGDGTDDQTYRNPNIAINGNTALVSYESNLTDNNIDVFSKTFNLGSNLVGAETTVADTSGGTGQGVSGSNVATLSNGGFVVVVGDQDPSPTDDDIFFQRFDSTGSKVGGLTATTSGGDYNQDPHVIGLEGGGFVIAWEIDSTDNSGNSGIRVQVFNNSGVAQTGLVSPQSTNAGNQSNAAVGALSDGGFVVAWIDENTDDVHGRRFDAAGATVGNEFNIDTNVGPLAANLDIEGMDDGRFIVTWTESLQTGNSGPPFFFPLYDTDIRTSIYDPRDEANSPNDYDGDIVIGTQGDDTIVIENADDEVYGQGGNDTFSFAASIGHAQDIYDGGSGTDRLLFTEAGTNNFGTADFNSIEEIEFQSEAFVSTKTVIIQAEQFGSGRLANNLLVDGNGAGVDAIDILRIDMGNDTEIDLSGLTFQDWEEFDSILINGDSSEEMITGTSQSDTISGAGGVDTILGGDMADDLSGGAEGDFLYGEDGDDMIDGGDGRDLLAGGAGRDTIIGGDGGDFIFGNAGIDFIDAGGGVDEIDGGLGFDRVWYGASSGGVTVDLNIGQGSRNDAAGDTYTGIERVTGSSFSDSVVGNDLANSIKTGDGDDIVFGRAGRDVIEGQAGKDELYGGSSNDNLLGGDDNDKLFGNSGFDRLFGGLGNDQLTGGGDNDYFVFETEGMNGFGADVVFDFQDGADRLDVRGVYSTSNPANTADQFSDFTVAAYGGGVRITFEAGQVINLDDTATGITVADIDASDFIFA